MCYSSNLMMLIFLIEVNPMKISDLINFEEIKDVIDIDCDLDNIEDKQQIVNNYIISDRLKPNIIEIAKNLRNPTHKSFQIIGGYGSGKSHLLGWIISILENHELINSVKDEEIREEFQKTLRRKFIVIRFELQPGEAELSEFFFDRVELQLKEKYNIEISSNIEGRIPDFKKDINEILNIIKKRDPTSCFVVIIDEISDFLKQKTRTKINRDTQFLRILGQVSTSLDFIFIGSMQENVFTDPKYLDEAMSFGRVAERFHIITISREDIKKVIAERVLKKTVAQKDTIDSLLDTYKKNYPIIISNIDEFIELYPVHPYVIKLFTELPYFEKRGVIQFTIDQVKRVLDKEFPEFITYENVYDEINSRHTIRNLDEIFPIIEIIETLDTKIDLLDERHKTDAHKLVKALAILRIYGKTTNNGATPNELANELLITSKTVKITDKIEIILNQIRDITSGQFIAKTKNNYYYLNMEEGPDYDLVIENKMKNLPDGMIDDELLKLLKFSDLVIQTDEEFHKRVYLTTCSWVDKKAFRLGHFLFDDSSRDLQKGNMDFNLVLTSFYNSNSKIKSASDTAIVDLAYDENLEVILKKICAIKLLIGENYAKSVMQRKISSITSDFKEKLLNYLLGGELELNGEKRRIKTIIKVEPNNIDEFFHYLIEETFNSHFNVKYSKFPKFLNELSFENIKGEIDNAITELLNKGESNLFSNSKNLLSSLKLMDIDGNIDTSNSVYAKVIIEELEANKGKNVEIIKLYEKLSIEPFGLYQEMIQLILLILAYNGEINLKKRGGGTITSSDLLEEFETGLQSYQKIPYAALEVDFPVESLIKIFIALELPVGLIRNPKDRTKAVRKFRARILEDKDRIESITRVLNEILVESDPIIDINEIIKKSESLADYPIEKFLNVQSVNDFKAILLSDLQINNIKGKLELIDQLESLIKDYNDFLSPDYLYMKKSLEWMNNHPNFFSEEDKLPLNQIRVECKPLVLETENVLDSNQRRVLKGKLQQYLGKYRTIYFSKHNKIVGGKINWLKLETLRTSQKFQKLRLLKSVKCINPSDFNKLEEKLLSLSKMKCSKLQEENLKNYFFCPYCRFPELLKEIENIDSEVDQIDKESEIISKDWNRGIIDEIAVFEKNLDLLSNKEKLILEQILSTKTLPDVLNAEIISGLNKLFSELKEIKISGQDFLLFIFSDSNILDIKQFSDKLNMFLEYILSKGEKEHIRIKKEE